MLILILLLQYCTQAHSQSLQIYKMGTNDPNILCVLKCGASAYSIMQSLQNTSINSNYCWNSAVSGYKKLFSNTSTCMSFIERQFVTRKSKDGEMKNQELTNLMAFQGFSVFRVQMTVTPGHLQAAQPCSCRMCGNNWFQTLISSFRKQAGASGGQALLPGNQ